jgi:hypothetical protein
MNLKMEDKKAYITIIEAEKLAENLFFTVGNDGISCKDSFLKGYKAALKLVEIKFASDFAEWISENNFFRMKESEANEHCSKKWFKIGDARFFTTTELQQEFIKTYKG